MRFSRKKHYSSSPDDYIFSVVLAKILKMSIGFWTILNIVFSFLFLDFQFLNTSAIFHWGFNTITFDLLWHLVKIQLVCCLIAVFLSIPSVFIALVFTPKLQKTSYKEMNLYPVKTFLLKNLSYSLLVLVNVFYIMVCFSLSPEILGSLGLSNRSVVSVLHSLKTRLFYEDRFNASQNIKQKSSETLFLFHVPYKVLNDNKVLLRTKNLFLRKQLVTVPSMNYGGQLWYLMSQQIPKGTEWILPFYEGSTKVLKKYFESALDMSNFKALGNVKNVTWDLAPENQILQKILTKNIKNLYGFNDKTMSHLLMRRLYSKLPHLFLGMYFETCRFVDFIPCWEEVFSDDRFILKKTIQSFSSDRETVHVVQLAEIMDLYELKRFDTLNEIDQFLEKSIRYLQQQNDVNFVLFPYFDFGLGAPKNGWNFANIYVNQESHLTSSQNVLDAFRPESCHAVSFLVEPHDYQSYSMMYKKILQAILPLESGRMFAFESYLPLLSQYLQNFVRCDQWLLQFKNQENNKILKNNIFVLNNVNNQNSSSKTSIKSTTISTRASVAEVAAVEAFSQLFRLYKIYETEQVYRSVDVKEISIFLQKYPDIMGLSKLSVDNILELQ